MMMVFRTSNLKTHTAINASAQVDAFWFLMGTASTYQVDRSMVVKTCDEVGRGPTMSTWIRLNQWLGTGMVRMGAAGSG
jgi:hypothetical protein